MQISTGDYRVPLAHNTLTDEELTAVIQTFHSGRLTQGPEVERFERSFADMHGVKHGILVNSGSSANLIVIEAIVYLSRLRPDSLYGPIDSGDEVIIQGLNWPSTITPLLNRGLRPVFCDVNIETLNADIDAVDAVRTEKTKIVVAVPVLGNPEGLDELKAYCDAERLLLIEDACESLGAITVSGRHIGTLGIGSAFSFYFSHHISTIEGGAILTNDSDLADFCYALRSHGWNRQVRMSRPLFQAEMSEIDARFCFFLPGYNVRATELSAAIGRVQLSKLPNMLVARRRIAGKRISALRSLGDLVEIPGAAAVDRHSWMSTPLLFRNMAHRRRAQAALEAAGIETRPIVVGNILRHPMAKLLPLGADQAALPVCDQIFDCGIMIGLNPFSTEDTETYICDAIWAAARA